MRFEANNDNAVRQILITVRFWWWISDLLLAINLRGLTLSR